MPNDDHVALLGHGAAVWNEWRAKHDGAPDLSGAGLRGLDLSGFDLSRAELRDADLRGTNLSGANLSGAHLEGANFFKAVLDGADLAGAFLDGAQFLNCGQLVASRNWQSAFRDETLAAPLFPTGCLRNRSVDYLDGDPEGQRLRSIASVARQIDELQHRAVGIVKIGTLTFEHAALPVLLERDLDAMGGQMMERHRAQVVRERQRRGA